MAEEGIATPEEKLLKIIENPQAKKDTSGQAGSAAAAKKAGVWLARLRIDKDAFKRLNLQTASKAIVVVCVIFTVLFVVDFFRTGSRLKERFKKVKAEAAARPDTAKSKLSAQISVTDVIANSRRRNIFTFLPSSNVAQAEGMPQDVAQILSNLKLVGIIWSANPQAMIESVKDQKTYLLNTGEQIDILTIKKIYKDKVMLGKDKQEWELR
jgi:type II secretory pathway component PulC